MLFLVSTTRPGVLVNRPAPNEHLAATYSGHDPGNQWMSFRATQADDDVLDAAHDFTRASHHRSTQKLRQMNDRQPRAGMLGLAARLAHVYSSALT